MSLSEEQRAQIDAYTKAAAEAAPPLSAALRAQLATLLRPYRVRRPAASTRKPAA